MRWAIAVHDAGSYPGAPKERPWGDAEKKMLQFTEKKLEVHHVNITNLDLAARQCDKMYAKKVSSAMTLLECGKKVKFVQYEYFDDAQPSCPAMDAINDAATKDKHGVRRVHGKDISTHVTNADEVYAYFMGHPFISFQERLRRANANTNKNLSMYSVGDRPGEQKNSFHEMMTALESRRPGKAP
jgi:hypothetical protein